MQPITGLWSLARLNHESPTTLTIDVTPNSPPWPQTWTIKFGERQFQGIQAREVIDKLGRSYEQRKAAHDWTLEDHALVVHEAQKGNVYKFPLPWENDPNYSWFVTWLHDTTERAMVPYRVSDGNRHRFIVDRGDEQRSQYGLYWDFFYEVRPTPYRGAEDWNKILSARMVVTNHEFEQSPLPTRYSLEQLGYMLQHFGYKADDFSSDERTWRSIWWEAQPMYAIYPENHTLRFYKLYDGSWACARGRMDSEVWTHNYDQWEWGDTPTQAAKRLIERDHLRYGSDTIDGTIDKLVTMVYDAWDEDFTKDAEWFNQDRYIAVEFFKRDDKWVCATYYRNGSRLYEYDEQIAERVSLAAYKQQQRLKKAHEVHEQQREHRRELEDWWQRMEDQRARQDHEDGRQDQSTERTDDA